MRRLVRTSATLGIIGINVVFFLAVLIASIFLPSLWSYIALTPSYIIHGERLWTIITAMFMHAGLFHLFANMFSLLFLGSFLERLIGQKRFLGIYFGAGIIGSLMYVFFSSGSNIPAIGASGAIFGVAGMLAVLTPKMPVYILFIPIAMPMWLGVVLIMAVLWALSISAGLPIGNSAHLGGLLAGLFYAFYLKYKYPRKTKMISNHFS